MSIDPKNLIDDKTSLLDLFAGSGLDSQDDTNEPNLFELSPYYDSTDFAEFISTTNDNFIVISLNCQSLAAKFDQLQIYINTYNDCHCRLSAICLQETWLSADSDLSLFQIEGYNLISSGKSSSAHGGVAIYLHETFKFKIIDKFISSDNWDGQFIEVLLGNNYNNVNKVIIGNLYRPPRQIVENIKSFTNDLNSIFNYFRNFHEVLLTGDFNINILKFKKVNYVNEFLEAVISNGYIPKITFPTRLTQRKGTLIDNFFIKTSNRFENAKAGIILNQISDHLPYFISLNYLNQNSQNAIKYIKTVTFNNTALLNLKNDIQSSAILQRLDNVIGPTPDISYDNFNTILQDLVNKHFPVKYVRFNKYKHKKNKWISSGILKSIKSKDKLYTMLKSTNCNDPIYESRLLNFQTYNKILKCSIRTAKRIYYNNQFEIFRNDIRKTWSTINEVLHKTTKSKEFQDTFMINGNLINDKATIANKFNEYFVEIGPKLAEKIDMPENQSYKDYLKYPFHRQFHFKPIETQTLIKVIDTLKPKSSYGHDRISNKLLKYLKFELADPLKALINQSIEHAVFPKVLKVAKVTPLHKKDDEQIFSNYRPISILPSVSKVFERVMYNQIYSFFTKNKLLYSSQYGFRQSHSTELAALELMDKIIHEIDNKKIPINIYLDLSKAFDTLDHEILLHKLSHYGIRNSANDFLKSYLTGRMQYVQIEETTSDYLELKCGVPQGSILGPLLFIIYVNDIVNATSKFHPVIYADDTTLAATLNTFGTEENIATNINSELKAIANWLKLNKLSLNINKTKAMVFHSAKRRITTPNIFIEGTQIEFVNKFNFLGILIDKNLNWKPHIDHISKKISKTIGVMNRLKNFLPSKVLLIVYNSLILSYLNYGLIIWGWKANKLTTLQKKSIRIIAKAKYNAHTSPLFKQFSILKLSDLCALQDFKFCYKLRNNMLPLYFQSKQFLSANYTHNYSTRHSNNNLPVPAVRHDFARNGMSYRYPVVYNNMNPIYKDKISTHNLNGFKFYIKRHFIQSYETMCFIPNCYICGH